MSVRTTFQEGTVALFDSVTGVAFGEVFNTQADAEDFLNWLHENHTDQDARALPEGELAQHRHEWNQTQSAKYVKGE